MNSEKFSIKSQLKSFRYAYNGIISLFKNEHNSRIHLIAACLSILAGILLRINLCEWSIVVVVIGFVFFAELINSAIERLADLIDPDWNESIMKAKDYSAAAVLIAAIVAIIAGCFIFIPKLLALL